MLQIRNNGMFGYNFCNQTVSIYHASHQPEFRCRRIVFQGAYFDSREVGNVDVAGRSKERRCFILLPCGGKWPNWLESEQTEPLQGQWFHLEPGDRILKGEGPEIITRQQWSSFIPVNVPGLAVIKEVSAKEWKGIVRHVEAEAEWYKRW